VLVALTFPQRSSDYWRWQPHPEVWLLMVSIAVLAVYAVRVIGPKAVPRGEPVVTRAQKVWFAIGFVVLWAAADWPMHDIGEEYLYSVHMVQHLLLTMVVPPMMLMATPAWLARLIVGQGRFAAVLKRLAHPVAAGFLFGVVTMATHAPAVVNYSVTYGALHYGVHVAVFSASLLMWLPVCGPLRELRVSLPVQMVYLFIVSIIPTVPAAWLTLADGVVYKAYDIPYRLGGIGVTDDQQTAGLIMKLVGGFYLWTIIVVLFAKWATSFEREEHDRRKAFVPPATEETALTWDDVADELERLGPAPTTEPPR
jgi:putative membrane protein